MYHRSRMYIISALQTRHHRIYNLTLPKWASLYIHYLCLPERRYNPRDGREKQTCTVDQSEHGLIVRVEHASAFATLCSIAISSCGTIVLRL